MTEHPAALPEYSALKHYERLYAATPREFAFRATDAEGFARWQEAFRPRLVEALGLNVMAHDMAGFRPTAERETSEDLGDITRELWHIWTEPDVPVPFYLLKPNGAKGPRPFVLTPHGHSHPPMYAGIPTGPQDDEFIRSGQRDIAVQAAREGYIAIAPTSRGFGRLRTEKAAEKDELCSCRIQHLHGLLVGRTVIGERVWDMSRLIDWALAALPIVPERIAITGNSSGGTTSLFAAAVDTRIAVAVPSCYFCTFAASIGSIYHCDCNYFQGMLNLAEMYEVAGLIAPRPVRMVAGQADQIFPIDAVRFAFAELQRIYRAAGVPGNCSLYIGPGGHRYYSDGVWPFIREVFSRT